MADAQLTLSIPSRSSSFKMVIYECDTLNNTDVISLLRWLSNDLDTLHISDMFWCSFVGNGLDLCKFDFGVLCFECASIVSSGSSAHISSVHLYIHDKHRNNIKNIKRYYTTSTTCDEDDNDDFSVSNDFSVACVRGLLFTESTYVIPAQDKQESERTLSHTRLFSSALVVLAWSWCSRHRGTREFCLVEAEFLLRFLLCMMLQELREAIQTYLARGDSNSLCRGRHNRGFSVFIPFQVCAFLLRCRWCFCLQRLLWCMVLQELREAIQAAVRTHKKRVSRGFFVRAELNSKGCQ